MSSYYETLDMRGKERYKEKLKPVGLSISHTEKFCSDMSQWPKIEFGYIFAYIFSRPGTYTQQNYSRGSKPSKQPC